MRSDRLRGCETAADPCMTSVRGNSRRWAPHRRGRSLHLPAAEAREGRKYFSGLIIVTDHSSNRTLADLRGRTMALGDPTSTTGR